MLTTHPLPDAVILSLFFGPLFGSSFKYLSSICPVFHTQLSASERLRKRAKSTCKLRVSGSVGTERGFIYRDGVQDGVHLYGDSRPFFLEIPFLSFILSRPFVLVAVLAGCAQSYHSISVDFCRFGAFVGPSHRRHSKAHANKKGEEAKERGTPSITQRNHDKQTMSTLNDVIR